MMQIVKLNLLKHPVALRFTQSTISPQLRPCNEFSLEGSVFSLIYFALRVSA